MPYAAVTYPNSGRPYTFFTSRKDLAPGVEVLVKDARGLSFCKFINYVPKPAFRCQVIVTTRLDLEEMAESARVEMDLEAEEPSSEEVDGAS